MLPDMFVSLTVDMNLLMVFNVFSRGELSESQTYTNMVPLQFI